MEGALQEQLRNGTISFKEYKRLKAAQAEKLQWQPASDAEAVRIDEEASAQTIGRREERVERAGNDNTPGRSPRSILSSQFSQPRQEQLASILSQQQEVNAKID